MTGSTTATFLFTDIEGSTQLAKRLHDGYPDVLAEHHRLLQGVFAANDGEVVDTQGDAFFVAFRRARDAVLAAASAQRVLARHPWPTGGEVRVRMGIHTGEATVADGRYVGLAVHRAARICAAGHGGQVLVSQTTADHVEDDAPHLQGVSLRDLGAHDLKDIDRPVHVYQLDVEGLPSDFPPLAKVTKPRAVRRRTLLAVAALLVAAIGATAFLVGQKGADAVTVVPNSLVRIDPTTNKPTDAIQVGDEPDLVEAAGDYVWVTHNILGGTGPDEIRNTGDRILSRVDTRTNEVRVVGGGIAPCGLALDPSGDAWVASCTRSGAGVSATVVRVDAKTLAFTATWPIPAGEAYYRGLTFGGGWLWIGGDAGVTRLNPRTGEQHQIPANVHPGALAWADGYGDLWVSEFSSGSVARIHDGTGVAQRAENVGTNPASVAFARASVWVTDWDRPRLYRIDATSLHEDVIELPTTAGAWRVSADESGTWATTPRGGTVWRIDPDTGVPRPIVLGYRPTGVTTADTGVWVTVSDVGD